jgi:hypothetical protein
MDLMTMQNIRLVFNLGKRTRDAGIGYLNTRQKDGCS